MMNERFELNDMDMILVNGGNYGDKKADDNFRKPKYCAGSWVEVYNTPLHISTTRYFICKSHMSQEKGYWEYDLCEGEGSETVKTVTANSIERK